MTGQTNQTAGDPTPKTDDNSPPSMYKKPVTTLDGTWRLEVTTLFMTEHMRIVKVDTKTGEIIDAAYIHRDQVYELRDLLVESFGPPEGCIECPFSHGNSKRMDSAISNATGENAEKG